MEFGTPVEEQKEVSPPKLKTSQFNLKSSKSKESEDKKSKEKDEFSDSLTEEDLEGLDVPENLPLSLKLSSADLLSPPKKTLAKKRKMMNGINLLQLNRRLKMLKNKIGMTL